MKLYDLYCNNNNKCVGLSKLLTGNVNTLSALSQHWVYAEIITQSHCRFTAVRGHLPPSSIHDFSFFCHLLSSHFVFSHKWILCSFSPSRTDFLPRMLSRRDTMTKRAVPDPRCCHGDIYRACIKSAGWHARARSNPWRCAGIDKAGGLLSLLLETCSTVHLRSIALVSLRCTSKAISARARTP